MFAAPALPRPRIAPAASATAARQLVPPPSMPIAYLIIEAPKAAHCRIHITIPKKYHLPSGTMSLWKSFFSAVFIGYFAISEIFEPKELNSAGQLVFFWT
jgi:hypothetical protein